MRKATALTVMLVLVAASAARGARGQEPGRDDRVTALDSLVESERAFARLSGRLGQVPAFLAYFGDDVVTFQPLPVTGKEEDVVDQFAVYFLSEDGPPEGREDALRAAEVLGRLARSESSAPGELPVWDVHSLDAQRQANLLCWLYGADSRAFAEAVRRAGLPRERRSSCEDEYAQLAGSWAALLAPYLTTPATPVSAVGQGPRALR